MISDIYFFSAMSPKVMIHGAIIGLNSRTLNENLLILLIWILFGAFSNYSIDPIALRCNLFIDRTARKKENSII